MTSDSLILRAYIYMNLVVINISLWRGDLDGFVINGTLQTLGWLPGRISLDIENSTPYYKP